MNSTLTTRPSYARLPRVLALALIALALVARPGVGRAQTAESQPTQAFGPSETLRFRCKYMGVTAGRVDITVGAATQIYGKTVWPLIASAQTEALFSIYPLKDRLVTWFDPVERMSIASDFQQLERGQKRRDRVRYYRDSARATTTRDRDTGTAKESYNVLEGAQDLLAAIYRIRGEDLDIGAVRETAVFTGSKSFTLRIRVVRKETIVAAGKSREALVLAARMGFDGNLADKRDAFVWVSNDTSHIPLKVDAEFAIGSFVAELTSYTKGITVASQPPMVASPTTTP